MFKVEIICDAKKLPSALMALDGLGYNLQVTPVRNAQPSGKRVIPLRGDATARACLMANLRRSGHKDQVSRQDLIKWGANEGHSAGSIAQAINTIRKDGVLTSITPGHYAIVHTKL